MTLREIFVDILEHYAQEYERDNKVSSAYYKRLKHQIEEVFAPILEEFGLHMNVLGGQGIMRKDPYISFLAEGHQTSRGIFPGYQFYLEQQVVVFQMTEAHDHPPQDDLSRKFAQLAAEFLSDFQSTGERRYPRKHYSKESLQENLLFDDLRMVLEVYQLCLDEFAEEVQAYLQTGEHSALHEPQEIIWAIQAGEGGKFWEEWQEHECISIGWSELGNPSGLRTVKEVREALLKAYPTEVNPKYPHLTHNNNAHSVNNFVNTMRIGDPVAAIKGRNTILGVGEILSDHQFMTTPMLSDPDHANIRIVRWLKTTPVETNHNLPTKTLTPLYPRYKNYPTVKALLQRSPSSLTSKQMNDLIDRFLAWHANDPHRVNEHIESYQKFSWEYFEGLTDEELVQVMFQFAHEGGRIQSSGYRTAPLFRKSMEAQLDAFRELILEIFSEEFDIEQWWSKADSFKGFGKGIRSIFLHRVFPDRFAVFNNKSREAFQLLGVFPQRKPHGAFEYGLIQDAAQQLIAYRPDQLNFYRVDAIAEFLIGRQEGQIAWNEIQSIPVSELSPSQFEMLWQRFQSRVPDFQDFTNPGKTFQEDELIYKRKVLQRYEEELGNHGVQALLDSGQGQKALNEVSKRVTSNFVQFNSWRQSIGDTDEQAAAILQAFLDVSRVDYQGPDTVAPIFDATVQHGLKPSWDTLSVVLWAMRPTDYAPIKISYYRKLAEEIGQPLPAGRPTPETFDTVLQWMKGFWKHLEPYTPADWIDVQSFIWCVCPDSRSDDIVKEPGEPYEAAKTVEAEPSEVKYWWLNANPKIWDFNELPIGEKQTYTSHNERANKRQLYAAFQGIKPGDMIIGYVTSPRKEIVALCQLTKGLHHTEEGEVIEFEKVEQLITPVGLSEVQNIPELENCRPIINNQGSLFPVTNSEYEIIRAIIDEHNIPPTVSLNPEYSLEACAEHTGFQLSALHTWIRAIHRKKQVIFYGPPGTGKTFVAEQLARHIIGGGDGCCDIVQFHPAYAYEDFMQGLRPQTRDDGRLEYRSVPGRFLDFCQDAQFRNDPCVLIIDEINRANLSRVFGELMYLLEYRDKAVYLSNGTHFQIPENVRIIGTMNTADRSIALVDYALRRRFAFLALRPDYDVLRHYHHKHATGFPIDNLIEVLRQVNRQIRDAHYEVGISFFLHANLTEDLEDIWRMEIEPYLEEYFFDQPAKVEEFRWTTIREKVFA